MDAERDPAPDTRPAAAEVSRLVRYYDRRAPEYDDWSRGARSWAKTR